MSANTASGAVDTGKVKEREHLRFETPSELRSHVGRLLRAEEAGRLKHSGNWTLGQALGHLAAWASFPYDGYPQQLNPPFFIRWILRMRKSAYIHKQLPAGVKIPKLREGTLATELLSTEEGLRRFNQAWDRLEKAPPKTRNIIFGELTHAEWIALNLRHAELHLSFQQG